MPRLLEVCSGTGSVGKIFKMHGWEVISLDIDRNARPTIVCDIRDFDYKQIGGPFDCVWCSPPCTHYSIARSNAKTPRDLEGSDQIVQQCVNIITWFKPSAWFIENPATSMMKHRTVVRYLPFVDVDYCMYGFPYRKRTRIWTNATRQSWTKLCEHDCGSSDGKRHKTWAQKAGKSKGANFTQNQLYTMPPLLCEEIYSAACGIMRLSKLA